MSKITYTDKVALNINQDVADVNKCNASDLNEIKQVVNENADLVGILENLTTQDKTSIVNAINEVNQNDINKSTYSTTEQVIGKWIDGKPVYRKVLNIGTPSSQRTYPTHGISNLENVIKLYGFCYTDGSARQIIPMTYTNWEIFAYDITDTVFTLNFSANQWSANPTNVYVVFEYTKTTD